MIKVRFCAASLAPRLLERRGGSTRKRPPPSAQFLSWVMNGKGGSGGERTPIFFAQGQRIYYPNRLVLEGFSRVLKGGKGSAGVVGVYGHEKSC